MVKFVAFASAALLATAVNAGPVTVGFTGTNANLGTTEAYDAGQGRTLEIAGFTFAGSGAAGSQINLTTANITGAQAANLQRSANGLGICPANNASCTQIESNNPRDEFVRLTVGSAPVSIMTIDLGDVDSDDTFNLFGFDGTSLVRLGFGGTGSSGYVAGGLGGRATAIPGAPANDFRINVNSAYYQAFYMLTNRQNTGGAAGTANAGDGYALKGITFDVPEPGTIGLLGLGIFAVAASRRRRA